jgi:hypothetical protein
VRIFLAAAVSLVVGAQRAHASQSGGQQVAPSAPVPQAPGPTPQPPPLQPAPPTSPPPAASPESSISGATISGARVSAATISGATISGAIISGSTISGGAITAGTITSGAVTVGAISGGVISAGTISAGTISGGTISGGTISGGTISGGTLSGATIAGAVISGATISGRKSTSPEPPPPKPSGGSPPATQPQEDRVKRPPSSERSAPGKRESGTPGQRTTTSGDDEEDEDMTARALERALVQRGALVLPAWAFEIAPGITYGHTSQDTVATVVDQAGTATTVAVRRRSHQLTASLTARLGLPWDFQLEASVPGERVWSDVAVAGAVRNDSYGLGLGDPRLSLTWQPIHGGSSWPDFLITGTWKPKVGSSPFDASAGAFGLGTGYQAIGGTLTAVKTADPLVFVASATHTANLAVTTKDGRRKPGDSWGLGGGAILAVSPEASMSFLLDFHYKPEDTLDGKAMIGTDETAAVLQVGVGMVVSRRVLLNFTLAMGLTADSPDLQLGVSAPVRF